MEALLPAVNFHEARQEDWSKMEPAMATLLKLLNNIVQDPGNAKYRVLKLSNQRLASTVFSIDWCWAFLLCMGFEKTTGGAVLRSDPQSVVARDEEVLYVWLRSGRHHLLHIQDSRDQLQAFFDAEIMNQRRRERDARIAAARAADAESGRHRRPAWPAHGRAAPCKAGDNEEDCVTVTLQSLADAAVLRLERGTRLGALRERVARERNCAAAQVHISLPLSNGSSQRLGDDSVQLLHLFGAAEGGTLCVSIGAQDELVVRAEEMPVAGTPHGRQLVEVAKQKSHKFTKELLANLVQCGELEPDRALELRKSLLSGERTAQEVRDIATSEAQQGRAVQCFSDRVETWEREAQQLGPMLQQREQLRRHSEMIALENHRGQMDAIRRRREG